MAVNNTNPSISQLLVEPEQKKFWAWITYRHVFQQAKKPSHATVPLKLLPARLDIRRNFFLERSDSGLKQCTSRPEKGKKCEKFQKWIQKTSSGDGARHIAGDQDGELADVWTTPTSDTPWEALPGPLGVNTQVSKYPRLTWLPSTDDTVEGYKQLWRYAPLLPLVTLLTAQCLMLTWLPFTEDTLRTGYKTKVHAAVTPRHPDQAHLAPLQGWHYAGGKNNWSFLFLVFKPWETAAEGRVVLVS